MMKLVATLRPAKLQSNHHHQQTNTQFLQAGCPSQHPTNSVEALKANNIKDAIRNIQSMTAASRSILR